MSQPDAGFQNNISADEPTGKRRYAAACSLSPAMR